MDNNNDPIKVLEEYVKALESFAVAADNLILKRNTDTVYAFNQTKRRLIAIKERHRIVDHCGRLLSGE